MTNSVDETGVRQAIGYYIDGMRDANVATLEKAFHEQAILCGYLGDELIAAPIVGLYEWVASQPAPEGFECSVLSVELTGRVATATVRETSHGETVLDHFHLLKVQDRWSIVSKLWDTERNRPA